MTKRERIYHALAHEPVDQIPKGELAIDPILANKVLGGGYSEEFQDFEREKAVREYLHMDYINIGDWPSWEVGKTEKGDPIFQSNYGEQYVFNGKSKCVIKPPFEEIEEYSAYRTPDIGRVTGNLIERFARETDLFVFAQIGGPISMINELIGMEDYMVACMTNIEDVVDLAKKIVVYEVQKAKLFIDKGANAIMLADDMAWNKGLLLPPYVMEEVAYPFYEQMIREIKSYRKVPVVLHTDGDINAALDKIVEAGFDGIQSLQPSAGMNLGQVKEKYGDKLCLIGNVDLDYVMSFAPVDEVRQVVRETILTGAKGSGFILSTCNCLLDIIPPENAVAMYEAAEAFDMAQI